MGFKKDLIFNLFFLVLVISTCLITVLSLDRNEEAILDVPRLYYNTLFLCASLSLISCILLYLFYPISLKEFIERYSFKTLIGAYGYLNSLLIILFFLAYPLDMQLFQDLKSLNFSLLIIFYFISFLVANLLVIISSFYISFQEEVTIFPIRFFWTDTLEIVWHIGWGIFFLLCLVVLVFQYPFCALMMIGFFLYQVNFLLLKVKMY